MHVGDLKIVDARSNGPQFGEPPPAKLICHGASLWTPPPMLRPAGAGKAGASNFQTTLEGRRTAKPGWHDEQHFGKLILRGTDGHAPCVRAILACMCSEAPAITPNNYPPVLRIPERKSKMRCGGTLICTNNYPDNYPPVVRIPKRY